MKDAVALIKGLSPKAFPEKVDPSKSSKRAFLESWSQEDKTMYTYFMDVLTPKFYAFLHFDKNPYSEKVGLAQESFHELLAETFAAHPTLLRFAHYNPPL